MEREREIKRDKERYRESEIGQGKIERKKTHSYFLLDFNIIEHSYKGVTLIVMYQYAKPTLH